MKEYGNTTSRLTERTEFQENNSGIRQQPKTFSNEGIVMCIYSNYYVFVFQIFISSHT